MKIENWQLKIIMQLSIDEIKHIANLARLELTDEELKIYGSQLSDVLSYIDQLKEVDVVGVEPTAQVAGLENITRADEVESWPADEVEASLGQVPDRPARRSLGEDGEDDFIKVKRVL